ncbi:MAG TPA: sulfite exporter TauE/SafE family protein [Candidatus Angelobacter sp.]
MTPSEAGLLVSAALVAGMANSIAGGGSFISFPTLLFTGMPPVNANATNTVAVWPGIVASTSAYRKAMDWPLLKSVMPLIIVTLLGSILGAWLLLHTPQITFLKMVPWLLFAGTVLFSMGPKLSRWVNHRRDNPRPSRLQIALITFAQLLLGLYIGYYGAGVGFLILPLLTMMGIENIHAMNGLRVLLATCGNAVAIVLFIVARAVIWPQALLMMTGAIVGGYAGAHYAQKLKPTTVRYLVISIGSVMTVYFFWKTWGI